MATLSIIKYSNKVWKFLASDVPTGANGFSFSKLQADSDGLDFFIVSEGGATTNRYQLSNITVFASVGGTAETGWTSMQELLLRLEELNFPAWNAVSGSGGATAFIQLTDTPASYSGQGGKVVAVKDDATGLEFIEGGGGSTPNLEAVLLEGSRRGVALEGDYTLTSADIATKLIADNDLGISADFEITIPQGVYNMASTDNSFGSFLFINRSTFNCTIVADTGAFLNGVSEGTKVIPPNTMVIIDSIASSGSDDWQTFLIPTTLGGETPTLQEVLDNNADLFDGNNFQGTGAGVNNTGINVNAFGQVSSQNNSGDYINAFGLEAGYENTGDNLNAFGSFAGSYNTEENLNAFGTASGEGNSGKHVNAFGYASGGTNSFDSVNLFGYEATADASNQTVFSKFISAGVKFLARLSFTNITADRKWDLPNTSGTIALTSDIIAGIESLTGDGVDNTDPLNPVLTFPTPSEIGAEPTITATTSADYYRGDKTFQPAIDLPINTATQTALDLKVDNSFLEEDFILTNLLENQLTYIIPPNGGATFSVLRTGTVGLIGNLGFFGTPRAIQFNTTAVAGTVGSLRGTNITIETFFVTKIYFKIITNVAGTRFFNGFSNMFRITAPTNVEPDTLINSMGVCKLSTSDNLHFIHNDGTGLATTIDCGVNFPATNVGDYSYTLKFIRRITDTDITMILVRNDGLTTSTVISSDAPTGFQSHAMYITNNTTADVASCLHHGVVYNTLT